MNVFEQTKTSLSPKSNSNVPGATWHCQSAVLFQDRLNTSKWITYTMFSIMLDDCTCLKHLQTTRFKKLRKVHNLPFISALGHFFFPNFPLTSLTKIPSKFLFSSSSYLKPIRTDKNIKYF